MLQSVNSRLFTTLLRVLTSMLLLACASVAHAQTSEYDAVGRMVRAGQLDLAQAKAWLELHGVAVEPVRVDEYTGRRFTFFSDPDGLPLELYEVVPSTT